MVNAVFGEVGVEEVMTQWNSVPEVKVQDGKITVGQGVDRVVIPF
jgi:hypothetical protein